MVFGRSSSAPEPTRAPGELSAAARLAALEARVDQVRTRIRQMASRERNNPVLVQLCLDVENDLHGPYPENAEESR